MAGSGTATAPRPVSRPAAGAAAADIGMAELALAFESLGGGSLNAAGWAFGCEFGFFQREARVEPLGLLRWASIAPADLLRGLEEGFIGVLGPDALELRAHTGWDWGYLQTAYGIYNDHTNMPRVEVPAAQARRRILRSLTFLRAKLIADLCAGEKRFIYRTFDHVLPDEMIAALAEAVGAYGRSTLCYVRTGDQPFTARRLGPHLIVGQIDRFAPRDGRLLHNPHGWERVCRAMLAL